MNNAAMNIGVQMSFQLPLGYIPEVGLLDHMVILF